MDAVAGHCCLIGVAQGAGKVALKFAKNPTYLLQAMNGQVDVRTRGAKQQRRNDILPLGYEVAHDARLVIMFELRLGSSIRTGTHQTTRR
jgi:hypothetical protein